MRNNANGKRVPEMHEKSLDILRMLVTHTLSFAIRYQLVGTLDTNADSEAEGLSAGTDGGRIRDLIHVQHPVVKMDCNVAIIFSSTNRR